MSTLRDSILCDQPLRDFVSKDFLFENDIGGIPDIDYLNPDFGLEAPMGNISLGTSIEEKYGLKKQGAKKSPVVAAAYDLPRSTKVKSYSSDKFPTPKTPTLKDN